MSSTPHRVSRVISELVFPMAGNKALMEPILQQVYGMLDSLPLSTVSAKVRKKRSKIPHSGVIALRTMQTGKRLF